MATLRELTELLATSLGVRPRAMEWTADEMRNAGLLGKEYEEATCADAARLLIAYAGSVDLSHPAKVLDRFEALPVIGLYKASVTGQGTIAQGRMPEDDDLGRMAMQARGFGDFFETTLRAHCQVEWVLRRLDGMVLGHEAGQTFATLEFEACPAMRGPGKPYSYTVHFGTGEPRPPDDAAPCRLQRCTALPGEIVDVVRRVVGGLDAPLRYGNQAEIAAFLAQQETL